MQIMPSLAARVGLTLAIFTLLPVFTTASAQTFSGVGERAQGMAGAFVAVADDASATYWNPAALGWPVGAIFDAQIGISEDKTFVGMALPAVGVSFYRLPIVSPPASRENEGSGKVPIRTFSTWNLGLTVNQTLVKALVIGSTIRVAHGGFEGLTDHTGVDVDAGAILPLGNVRVGVTARNLSAPSYETGEGEFTMSRQVRAGVAFAPRSLSSGVHGPFSVAFDADLTKTQTPDGELRDAAAGAEYWIAKGKLGVRGGVRWSTLTGADAAVSGGLTVGLPHSAFVESHVTKLRDGDETEWGVGARFTF
jgi:hypothetical protein